MNCPNCNSTRIIKNGRRRGKQCYQCRHCNRQFVESPIDRSYSKEVKQLCLKMYLNGMGLRGIERVTDIHHTTIMNWIKEAGIGLPDAPQGDEIPEITELDELQTPTHLECIQGRVLSRRGTAGVVSAGGMRGAFRTFIGKKKDKVWIWTVVNHWQAGILKWTVGDRSIQTFQYLWSIIKCWRSFWYVSDGYPVYPTFIKLRKAVAAGTRMHSGERRPEDRLVSKIYMTRVEGENTRLRHYLARRHSPAVARRERTRLVYIEKLYVILNPLKCSSILFVFCFITLSLKLCLRVLKSLLIQQRQRKSSTRLVRSNRE